MTAKKLFLASYLQPGARRLLFQASFAKQVLCKQVLANKAWPNKPWSKKPWPNKKAGGNPAGLCFTEA
jgi:hypothetical protein